MDQAIKKADALIEALEYIRQFKGQTVVLKLGGSLMETDQTQKELLKDVAFMAAVGMHPILVHGGGKAINAALTQAGIQTQFVQGRRYTDQRTLAIAEHVLVRQINQNIVRCIQGMGFQAMGLHSLSSCVLFAEKLHLHEPDGRKIDIGLVGQVTSVNAELLHILCQSGIIPVIAPIARDPAGGKLNINADTAAGKVAAAVKAEKLVMMSDTHGIYKDPKDPETQISSVNRSQVQQLIKDQIITAGMLPKVQACLDALQAGVRRAHIIDGSFPHSPLLEIYTDKGVGTLITEE